MPPRQTATWRPHVARSCLAILLVMAGCGRDAVSPGERFIHIISQGTTRDTVLAGTGRALTVEVRDQKGAPVPGTRIQFETITPSVTDPQAVFLGLYTCESWRGFCAGYDLHGFSITNGVAMNTDANGRASVTVQFGMVAGPATLRIVVPSLGEREISYTTLPGALARVVATPQDTAVMPGASYMLASFAADRFGNRRTEKVTVAGWSPGIITVSSGTVTAVGPGRGRILLTANKVTDTAFTSVAPLGRLVAFGWAQDFSSLTRLTLVNTDGSGRRLLASTPGNNGNALPVWAPSGDRIVFDETLRIDFPTTLQITDTAGTRRQLLSEQNDFSVSMQSGYTSSGAIFFYGNQIATGLSGIYVAAGDGTGSRFIGAGTQPSPSPDGSRVAYVSDGKLYVRDLASGAVALVNGDATRPRWSPTGDLISFVPSGMTGVSVVRPDGTGLRTLTTGFHDYSTSWSPDGTWLVAARYSGGLEILRVSDGMVIPIPGTSDLFQPAWRP